MQAFNPDSGVPQVTPGFGIYFANHLITSQVLPLASRQVWQATNGNCSGIEAMMLICTAFAKTMINTLAHEKLLPDKEATEAALNEFINHLTRYWTEQGKSSEDRLFGAMTGYGKYKDGSARLNDELGIVDNE